MVNISTGSLSSYALIAILAGAFGASMALIVGNSVQNNKQEPALPFNQAVQASGVSSADSTINSDLSETVRQLKADMDAAEQERTQMATAAVQLSRELFELQQQVEILEGESEERAATEIASVFSEPLTGFTNNRRGGGRFNNRLSSAERVENLIAVGIDEQTAKDIQSRSDQHQLARLELLDQAAREGWSDSDRLTSQLNELDESRVNLREELGDFAYDKYLYESGLPNRVNIASVITGSAANIAGLKVGDLIVSYNNARIFRVRELQEATRSGNRGEYVQVIFDRGGRSLTTDIPRGPLGVTLNTSSIAP